jgi:hypothetical protein
MNIIYVKLPCPRARRRPTGSAMACCARRPAVLTDLAMCFAILRKIGRRRWCPPGLTARRAQRARRQPRARRRSAGPQRGYADSALRRNSRPIRASRSLFGPNAASATSSRCRSRSCDELRHDQRYRSDLSADPEPAAADDARRAQSSTPAEASRHAIEQGAIQL